jgi:hypothetical protein
VSEPINLKPPPITPDDLRGQAQHARTLASASADFEAWAVRLDAAAEGWDAARREAEGLRLAAREVVGMIARAGPTWGNMPPEWSDRWMAAVERLRDALAPPPDRPATEAEAERGRA